MLLPVPDAARTRILKTSRIRDTVNRQLEAAEFAFGMTSLLALENHDFASTGLRRTDSSIRAISSLPDELLDFIFLLALPYPDVLATEWWWSDQPCHPYMAALFSLRRVCKLWKNLADSTPALWSVISSTFTRELNEAFLARSGTCPLLIHYLDYEDEDSTSPFQDFLLLIGPHLRRSGSVAIQFTSDVPEEIPDLASPHLVNINFQVSRKSSRMLPMFRTPLAERIEIREDTLKNLKGLALSGVQLDWRESLHLLTGLSSLELSGVFEATIADEQLLDVLIASPDLENLSLHVFYENGTPGPDLLSSREPVCLPHLHSVMLSSDSKLVDFMLRKIRPPPNMISLDIYPHNFPSPEAATTFWMDAAAIWAPAVRQLHNESDSAVRILSRGKCDIVSEEGRVWLSLSLSDLTSEAAFSWIGHHIGESIESEGGKGLHVESWPIFLQDHDVLTSVQVLPAISKLSAMRQEGGAQLKEMEGLLTFLCQAIPSDMDTTGPKPSFPKLQILNLQDWVWNMDAIENMIRRRYALRSTTQYHIADLTVEITLEDPWSSASGIWRDRAIISLSTLTTLRRMEGLKEVSIRCRYAEPGLLAVIWNEEQSAPSWL
ncbi:hypothetical protein FRB90_012065 [Tulasnella sp. 427]|nr:hypothetical protein FRB90_012065 [Tulasnella sp. 427]